MRLLILTLLLSISSHLVAQEPFQPGGTMYDGEWVFAEDSQLLWQLLDSFKIDPHKYEIVGILNSSKLYYQLKGKYYQTNYILELRLGDYHIDMRSYVFGENLPILGKYIFIQCFALTNRKIIDVVIF